MDAKTILSAALLISGASVASAQQVSAVRPMEAVYHNIQVLRGVPSSELLPIMNFMRASLGVRCEFCHIAEDGKYQLDDRAPKRRTREMIVMTKRLNDSAFAGRPVVTCQTCHHGSLVPDGEPAIGSAFISTLRREAGESSPPALPAAADLFARFEALTHLASMPTSRFTLEASHARVVEPGTPRARAVPRALSADGTVLIDGRRALARSPLGDGRFMLVGCDGTRAWTDGPNGVAWIPDADFAAFQRKLNPLVALRTDDLVSATVSGIERLEDRDTYAVRAVTRGGDLQRLWFQRDTGLLVRRTFFHELPLGLDPEQIDFGDYMDFGGFLVPVSIDTSYLDDEHLGVLKRVLTVEIGVKASDGDFAPPKRPRE